MCRNIVTHVSFFESVHASCEWEAGNGIFLRAYISWLQTCPWTLWAFWLVEGGELWANGRPPGILACWQWRAGPAWKTAESVKPTRHTGRDQPEQPPPELFVVSRLYLPIQLELSVQLFIDTGMWGRALVGQMGIDFHSAFPSYVCLACMRVAFGLQWSRSVSGWFEVSSLVLP